MNPYKLRRRPLPRDKRAVIVMRLEAAAQRRQEEQNRVALEVAQKLLGKNQPVIGGGWASNDLWDAMRYAELNRMNND